MDFERELTLNDYINIVKRRFPYVAGFFFLTFSAVIAFAVWLTPVYQSSATILIKSQQVTQDQSTAKFAADRFATLQQVVLSNENLAKIAEKYKIHGLEKNPNLPRASVVNATRANISVELLQATGDQWGNNSTYAFKIGFTHYNAEDTYNITNDLVKLFLDENDRVGKENVTETTEFFTKEAEKRKAALEKIENEITNYKRLHSDSLPENKDMQVSSLERLENDLRATQREYNATQAELRSLDVSLESAKAGIGLNTPQERISSSTDLDGLKLELAKQKSIYSDNHPSVRALQRRIDAMEKSLPVESSIPAKSVTTQSVMVAKVQAQIDTANVRLKSLETEEASIRAKISQTEGRVMRSSQTEGALGALLRDYDNAKSAYSEIKIKLDNSKIAKNIEMENKGERFVLTEAPVFPEKPIKPNRILIILAGFFGSIVAAICFAVLMDMFDKGVRGVDALASIMKIQPIATIPYITNKAELKRRKYLVSYISLSALIVVLLISLIVHFFVMPLDVLAAKIIARF
jgi:polysaccharide biosynthesis transport protein